VAYVYGATSKKTCRFNRKEEEEEEE